MVFLDTSCYCSKLGSTSGRDRRDETLDPGCWALLQGPGCAGDEPEGCGESGWSDGFEEENARIIRARARREARSRTVDGPTSTDTAGLAAVGVAADGAGEDAVVAAAKASCLGRVASHSPFHRPWLTNWARETLEIESSGQIRERKERPARPNELQDTVTARLRPSRLECQTCRNSAGNSLSTFLGSGASNRSSVLLLPVL
jgi:hypothetical protein